MRANSASLAWAKGAAGMTAGTFVRAAAVAAFDGVDGTVSGRVRRRSLGEADGRGGRGSIGVQCSGARPGPGHLESHTPRGDHPPNDDDRPALPCCGAPPRLPPLVLPGQGPAAPAAL